MKLCGRMVTKDILVTFLVIVQGCCSTSDNLEVHVRTVDYGDNVTLPCSLSTDGNVEHESESEAEVGWPAREEVMWVREGREDEQISRMSVQLDGSLILTNLDRDDAGVYLCTVVRESNDSPEQEEQEDVIRMRVKVEVRVPPPALANVTVIPSTVLALLLWEVEDTGGYPISHFSARYRLQDPSTSQEHQYQQQPVHTYHWHWVVPEHINPSVRQIDVYNLDPNSTYIFEIWASNQLGAGEITQLKTHTQHNEAEIELARHLLEGAETFDTRVWVAAVAVVMGTLVMLALGTCYLLYKECHLPSMNLDEHEIMELVPNIILNPGFHDEDGGHGFNERIERDENCNDRRSLHINNNSVLQPYRI